MGTFKTPKQPAIRVNGFDLNNGLTHQIDLGKATGLYDPAVADLLTATNTFGGKVPSGSPLPDYATRTVNLPGRLWRVGDFNQKHQVLEALGRIVQGKPALLQMGSLYFDAEFNEAATPNDALRRLPGKTNFSLQARVLNGVAWGDYLWAVKSGNLVVADDAPNRLELHSSVPEFYFINPAQAPGPARMALTGAADTVYYLHGAMGNRLAIQTDDAGHTLVTEAMGFILVPGAQRIRVENADGSLAAVVVSLEGTRGRYLGNYGNRFSEDPVLRFYRETSDSYLDAQGATVNVDPMRPRMSPKGLLLEGTSGPNKLTNPEMAGSGSGIANGWDWLYASLWGASYANNIQVFTSTQALGGIEQVVDLGMASGPLVFSVDLKGTGVILRVGLFSDAAGTVLLENVQSETITSPSTFKRAYASTTRTDVRSIRFQILDTRSSGWTQTAYTRPIAQYGTMPSAWGAATREGEFLYMGRPYNLLCQSERLDLDAWNLGGATALPGAATSSVGTKTLCNITGNNTNPITQLVDYPAAGNPLTFSIEMAAASNTQVLLYLINETGTWTSGPVIATVGTTPRRYHITATAPGGTVGRYKVKTIINQAGNTTLAMGRALVNAGRYPGVYIRSDETPIYRTDADCGPWELSQNGVLEFTGTITVPLASGYTYGLLGDWEADGWAIYRKAETLSTSKSLYIKRGHDAGILEIGGEPPAGINPYDGLEHDYRIEWTSADGALALKLSIDGQPWASGVPAGASEWNPLDDFVLAAGANSFALSDFNLYSPGLPMGCVAGLTLDSPRIRDSKSTDCLGLWGDGSYWGEGYLWGS